MHVLITGKGGRAGSWAIRGEQLGHAIGATIAPMATAEWFNRADVIVAVKRVPADLLEKLRGRKWVLDFVDGWPQPNGNEWGRDTATAWLRGRLRELSPTAVVFPTTRMLHDSGWTGPALVLPHHAWPKYAPQPMVPVQRVGYEGDPRYLGRWHDALATACRARGWTFVVNGDLASCQIGVALRDVAGYPAGAWKANTKLANLQALGLPALVSPEESYREFGSPAQTEITEMSQLDAALDVLANASQRPAVRELAMAAAPRIDTVAKTYRDWLETL